MPKRLINGKELTTKDGVQIEKDVPNNKYTLAIPKANPTVHAGVITIKATNTIGTTIHELNLDILGTLVFYDAFRNTLLFILTVLVFKILLN